MAEPDIATKAPENDAQETQVPKEPSMISKEDTPAQKGPSMGVRGIFADTETRANFELQDHCVTDRPTPTDGAQPSGEVSKIADVDVSQTLR